MVVGDCCFLVNHHQPPLLLEIRPSPALHGWKPRCRREGCQVWWESSVWRSLVEFELFDEVWSPMVANGYEWLQMVTKHEEARVTPSIWDELPPTAGILHPGPEGGAKAPEGRAWPVWDVGVSNSPKTACPPDKKPCYINRFLGMSAVFWQPHMSHDVTCLWWFTAHDSWFSMHTCILQQWLWFSNTFLAHSGWPDGYASCVGTHQIDVALEC